MHHQVIIVTIVLMLMMMILMNNIMLRVSVASGWSRGTEGTTHKQRRKHKTKTKGTEDDR